MIVKQLPPGRANAVLRGDTALRDGMYTAREDASNGDGHESERDPLGWRRARPAYRVGYLLIYPKPGAKL